MYLRLWSLCGCCPTLGQNAVTAQPKARAAMRLFPGRATCLDVARQPLLDPLGEGAERERDAEVQRPADHEHVEVAEVRVSDRLHCGHQLGDGDDERERGRLEHQDAEPEQ